MIIDFTPEEINIITKTVIHAPWIEANGIIMKIRAATTVAKTQENKTITISAVAPKKRGRPAKKVAQ